MAKADDDSCQSPSKGQISAASCRIGEPFLFGTFVGCHGTGSRHETRVCVPVSDRRGTTDRDRPFCSYFWGFWISSPLRMKLEILIFIPHVFPRNHDSTDIGYPRFIPLPAGIVTQTESHKLKPQDRVVLILGSRSTSTSLLSWQFESIPP